MALAAAAAAGCGSEDDRPASWGYISAAIIQPSCATASCHSKLTQTFGLNLETRENGYTFLVDGHFVIPGEPDESKLLYLLRGDEVRRMPPDGPLPDADIALIERWILEGAEDN